MIKIDWTLWLQFANFFVLMLVLNVLLYRPLRDMLNRRRETIDGSYRKAKEMEGQINEKMARYQEKLQEAKLKGSQEKAALKQVALKDEGEILGKARDGATKHLNTIKSQVAEEVKQAREALKGETEVLAKSIASRVLGREL